MEIVIIGGGSFGTAIAQELSANPTNSITLLFRTAEAAQAFNATQVNEKYFPNRQLDTSILGTSSWDVTAKAEVIFLAIPASKIPEIINSIRPHLKPETSLVNLAKGIYKDGKTLVDFLIEELHHPNTITLKGPSFSAEMINRQATLLTLGFSEQHQLKAIKEITAHTNIFLDYTNDIRGVEFLSALKNIYAILLGNVDAKHNAANTRFLVLTKAIAEIKMILNYLGGREDTIFLGCGLGDISLTALNDLSRNRTLGLLIGKGFYASSYNTNSVVLEGIKTLQLIKAALPERLNERLPLLQQISAFFLDKNQAALNLDFEEIFKKRYKTVITYGTYDLLHFGHLEILRRAKELGDQLIVGLSTDEFNTVKGKTCKFSYEKRKAYLESLSYVDLVIPERRWEQKIDDLKNHDVDIFVMGHDWEGKFNNLKPYCEVIYFKRTKGISTTKLKKLMDD